MAVLYGISAILGLTAVVTAASGLSRGLILLVVLGLAVIVMFKGRHPERGGTDGGCAGAGG